MIKEVILSLIHHPTLISIIGPFLFGGETILLLSILAGQGSIELWKVLVFCTIGIFLADTMWFLLGKIKIFSKLKKVKIIHRGYERASEIIDEFKNNLSILIMIKFAYGPGIPTLMYLGRKRMGLREYLKYNIPITVIWTFAIGITGWIIGKGYYLTVNKFKNIYSGIILVVTAILIINITIKIIRKKIIKKQKKKNR